MSFPSDDSVVSQFAEDDLAADDTDYTDSIRVIRGIRCQVVFSNTKPTNNSSSLQASLSDAPVGVNIAIYVEVGIPSSENSEQSSPPQPKESA